VVAADNQPSTAKQAGTANQTGTANQAGTVDELTELATLAGGLAHEIRNPLSTLKMNLQLLAEDWRSDADDEPDLRRRSLNRLTLLQGEVERLDSILDDFLRLVTRRELTLTVRDVNAVVDQMVDFYGPRASSGAVRLRTALHDAPLRCPLDPASFKQAILNVFLNAQEAMPEGGELIVRTAPGENDTVRIDITDTGVGIAPEQTAKVMQPYYSTKKSGSGLGLAMTQRIIGQHGGTLEIESEPGKGTNVIFRMPRAAAE
jgi:signal transduction histidine kinase